MAPKRKRQTSGQVQSAKKMKPAVEPPIAADYSNLPLHVLVMIFDFLKKDDEMMKPLTETCYKFYAMCKHRFVLRLDFNQIKDFEAVPEITRAYKDIKIVGTEIAANEERISEMLKSSKHSAQNLFIGNEATHVYPWLRIKKETMLHVLTELPNLRSVKLIETKVLPPRLASEIIADEKYPNLVHLKTLSLIHSKKALSAFKKASRLIKYESDSSNPDDFLNSFISNQRNLKFFKGCNHELEANSSPSLEVAELLWPYQQIAEFIDPDFSPDPTLFAPNIKDLTFHTYGFPFTFPETFAPNSNLKSITVKGPLTETSPLKDIVRIYPSLVSFRSETLGWTRL